MSSQPWCGTCAPGSTSPLAARSPSALAHPPAAMEPLAFPRRPGPAPSAATAPATELARPLPDRLIKSPKPQMKKQAVKRHHHKHNLRHRYEFLETLGKGTYGKVKKARESSGRLVSAAPSRGAAGGRAWDLSAGGEGWRLGQGLVPSSGRGDGQHLVLAMLRLRARARVCSGGGGLGYPLQICLPVIVGTMVVDLGIPTLASIR